MRTRRLVALAVMLCLPALSFAEGYALERVSREEAVLRSALVPGLGQIEQGRTGRGALWTGGAAALVAGTFFAHMEYHSAAKDLENAEDSYRRSIADDGDAAYAHFLEMQRLSPIADDRYDLRRNLEVGLVLWWGANLVDAWLFGGEGDAAAGEQSLLPGRLTPLLAGERAGLAWSCEF